MTVRELVGDGVFEGMKDLVRRTFPDERCVPTDELVSTVICALPEEARVAIGAAKATLDVAEELLERLTTPATGSAPEAASYFLVHATHTRPRGPGAHAFVGAVPMVRLRLPAAEPKDFVTKIGVVFAGDHLVYTRELVHEKYREVFEGLGFELGDVMLTTPARYLGARFAAVAIYELFDVEGARRGWILESGLATGEPAVLYASPSGKKIARKSWYVPTPFSSSENYYTGVVDFRDAGPGRMVIGVHTPGELAGPTPAPHVMIDATFEELPDPAPVFPSELTAQAALRVAAIAAARGEADLLFKVLAPFGRALPWVRPPAAT